MVKPAPVIAPAEIFGIGFHAVARFRGTFQKVSTLMDAATIAGATLLENR